MNPILFLAVFLLSPFSFSNNIAVPILGQTYYFNVSIYNQIQAPNISEDSTDISEIHHLSAEMPFLYMTEITIDGLPFRIRDTYERLIKGEDIYAQILKQEHTFFVFKDKERRVQGYIHGWIDQEKDQAIIDELVVAKKWRRRGIALTLMGRLLEHLSAKNSSIKVISRVPLSKKISNKFGIESFEDHFETSFVVDHLLSRFSINYLFYQNRRDVPKHQSIAEELRRVISRARLRDGFSINQAMSYLAAQIQAMEKEIQRKCEQAAKQRRQLLADEEEEAVVKDFYYGIQEDKYDVANVYFLMMVLSFLSDEASYEDSMYYEYRETYLYHVIESMREAQREGGLLPVQMQLFMARLYAFIRFLHEEEIGSAEELVWVQRSIVEYLRLMILESKGPRDIFVFPASIQIMVREVLWFKYDYKIAEKIALLMMKTKQEAIGFLRKNKSLSIEKKEQKMLHFFHSLQREVWNKHQIALNAEFGLLFFYVVQFYPEEEKAMYYKIGELFFLASFYSNEHKMLSYIYHDVEIMEGQGTEFSKTLTLTEVQKARLEELVRYFTKPFNADDLLKEKERLAISL